MSARPHNPASPTGAQQPVQELGDRALAGARLFFPGERASELTAAPRRHWTITGNVRRGRKR
jgi:hypothetical protein